MILDYLISGQFHTISNMILDYLLSGQFHTISNMILDYLISGQFHTISNMILDYLLSGQFHTISNGSLRRWFRLEINFHFQAFSSLSLIQHCKKCPTYTIKNTIGYLLFVLKPNRHRYNDDKLI